jgi:acetolactate synthase regulatory subunit
MTVPDPNGRGPAGSTHDATPAHGAPPPRALPGGGETRRHVLIAVVLNKPGVLNRVSSLMRARNFNIDSLAVSHTDSEDISRMTITLHGDDVAVEQAAKQLYRLIDVLKVQDVTGTPPPSTNSPWSRSAPPIRPARRSSSWSTCRAAGSWTWPMARSSSR